MGPARRSALSFIVCALAVLPFLGTDASAAGRAPTALEVTYSHVQGGQPAGQEMRFRVWIRSDAPATSSDNGTVTLRTDGNVIGSEPVPPNDNTVYINTPAFTRGEHVVSAAYSGSSTWEPSQASATVTVVGRYTEGALIVGDCSTKFTPPGGGSGHCHAVGGEETTIRFLFDRHWEWTDDRRPTGEVVFTASAPPSAFPSGFGPEVVGRADVEGIEAVLTTRDLPVRARDGTVGCYTLRADYEGDDLFNPASAAQGMCVSPPDNPDAPVAPQYEDSETTSSTVEPTPSTAPEDRVLEEVDRSPGVNQNSASAAEEGETDPDAEDGSDRPGSDTAGTGSEASAPFAGTARTRTSGGVRGPLTAAAGVVTTIAFGLSLAASGVGPWTPGSGRLR